ncbi:hypothetical protein GUJ93_ZPchr0269g2885 [Zizania palustris]|uniref:Uncharacterized protein n=1 Tax=Zizania palustris TaxID=103762 RepID=A0A8J5VD89_ZIZPA|nr:hypothetical protein GUJ93_ZPchr0269g2885 [Zizania palustris]
MAELVRRLRWPRLLPVVFVFLPALLAGGVHGARALDDGRARDKEAELIHATVSPLSVAVREGGGHPGGGHGGGGGTGGHGGRRRRTRQAGANQLPQPPQAQRCARPGSRRSFHGRQLCPPRRRCRSSICFAILS